MISKEKRRVLMLIAGTFILGLFTSTDAANPKTMKPYEIEEGRIEFELSGMTKGSEVLEFKDWGRRAATRSKNTVSIMGMTQETDQLTIIDGEWVYNVDLSRNTATKIKNPFYSALSEGADQSLPQTGPDMMKAMGGKRVGKDTMLGKPCDWWEIQQLMSKSCIWKGIGLKTIAGPQGMQITHTAVNIQLMKIPDSRFSLPPNVKIVKGEDPFKQLREFQSKSGGPRAKGRKDLEENAETNPQAPDMPDMQKMMEQIQKMQEEMRKGGLQNQ
jgi:hypothetical protein